MYVCFMLLQGMCLLHWACDRGHIDVLQLLLDNEAKINATDAEGQTALHYGKINIMNIIKE